MLNWSRDPIGPCFPASWRFFLAAGRHLGCHRLSFRVWFKEWGKVVGKFLNGDEMPDHQHNQPIDCMLRAALLLHSRTSWVGDTALRE